MTTREALQKALDRTVVELAEGDIKPNYNIDGESVSWGDYSQQLMDRAERLNSMIEQLGDDDGGIVEEVTQFCT